MQSVEKILTNVFDKPLRKLTERQLKVVFHYVKDWANLTSKQRKTKALEADKIRSTKERIQVERRARHTLPLTEIEKAEYEAAWNSEPDAAALEPASDRLATPAPAGTVGASGGVEPDKAVPDDKKPWLVADPTDPTAPHHWYTPARYFARKLVLSDSTLLNKRLMLADKVSRSLYSVGIYKRGGKNRHAADTVLKAFSNVTLG